MDDNSMERDDIVELLDENDNPVKFEHIITLEHEGDKYVLLSPLEDIDDDTAEGEIIILRIDEGEDDDVYVGIEDEALLETLFQKYLDMVEDDE